jgi:hypothetical protein
MEFPMKRFLAATALAVMCLSSCAQNAAPAAATVDPARAARVEKLFAVMHIERTTEQMMGMMQKLVMQSTQNLPGMSSLTPDQAKVVDAFQKKAMQLAVDTVGWKVMKPDYVRIYAAEFTDDQIDAMTAFYGSSAGQALLNKTPEISQQTMTIVQQKIVTLQPQMRALMDDMMKQLGTMPPAAKAPAASKN